MSEKPPHECDNVLANVFFYVCFYYPFLLWHSSFVYFKVFIFCAFQTKIKPLQPPYSTSSSCNLLVKTVTLTPSYHSHPSCAETQNHCLTSIILWLHSELRVWVSFLELCCPLVDWCCINSPGCKMSKTELICIKVNIHKVPESVCLSDWLFSIETESNATSYYFLTIGKNWNL